LESVTRSDQREQGVCDAVTLVTEQVRDSGTEDGALLSINQLSANGQCACGNALITPTAVWSGKCKPCRDKQMAGYDQ
jgi:hypothetical protein